MSLLKTSTLNGFGMAIKLLFALLANKVVAVMLGPNGMAVYGQFQSLMTLINGLAAAPAQAGVIRLTVPISMICRKYITIGQQLCVLF